MCIIIKYFLLLIIIVNVNCTNIKTVTNLTGVQYPQIFTYWEGEYTGKAKEGFLLGYDTKKLGNKDIQSKLSIKRYGNIVKVQILTNDERKKWIFDVQPSVFSSVSINFLSTQVENGRTFQYRITLSLTKNKIEGKLERISGPKIYYELELTKLDI